MTEHTSTALDTALAYYRAWASHDFAHAMTYIAENIVCQAPAVRLDGAEAFRAFTGPFSTDPDQIQPRRRIRRRQDGSPDVEPAREPRTATSTRVTVAVAARAVAVLHMRLARRRDPSSLKTLSRQSMSGPGLTSSNSILGRELPAKIVGAGFEQVGAAQSVAAAGHLVGKFYAAEQDRDSGRIEGEDHEGGGMVAGEGVQQRVNW